MGQQGVQRVVAAAPPPSSRVSRSSRPARHAPTCLSSAIDAVRDEYDVIILDVAPGCEALRLQALVAGEMVLIPSKGATPPPARDCVPSPAASPAPAPSTPPCASWESVFSAPTPPRPECRPTSRTSWSTISTAQPP
ncbi:ParA family protein [Streptomyces kaempferi]|uniref:ParA family protein n=1 Tax=Streptomyces kaempferi TaxID=333725 RepID=UPI0036D3BBAC